VTGVASHHQITAVILRDIERSSSGTRKAMTLPPKPNYGIAWFIRLFKSSRIWLVAATDRPLWTAA
jgi:hypothetical protein